MLNDVTLIEVAIAGIVVLVCGYIAVRRHLSAHEASSGGELHLSPTPAQEQEAEESDIHVIELSWLSKDDAVASTVAIDATDHEDIEWENGILTALTPEGKRIVLTCPPRAALIYCGEQTPTTFDDVEYIITLKDGDTVLGEWKVYSDADGPNLEGNYWWASDDDDRVQFALFAGRDLTIIAREA